MLGAGRGGPGQGSLQIPLDAGKLLERAEDAGNVAWGNASALGALSAARQGGSRGRREDMAGYSACTERGQAACVRGRLGYCLGALAEGEKGALGRT